MLKHSSEQRVRHCGELCKMSENVKGPITDQGRALQASHKNLQKTHVRSTRETASFTPNIVPMLKDEKINLISMLLQ